MSSCNSPGCGPFFRLSCLLEDNQEVDALQKLKQKLNSQTGASITFALLLFLVCAVVGSAVLAAGTAAAGRMSKIAEMDQRYYAVNSAARLLVDTIQEKPLEIVKKETAETGTPVYEIDGEPVSDPASSITSIPLEAAYWLGYLSTEKISEPMPLKLALRSDKAELNNSIEVLVDETINPDGSLIFEIRNKTSGTDTAQYGLRMSFGLDKVENDELNMQKNEHILTTTLQWKLSDIGTIVNRAIAPASTPASGG